MKTQRIQPDDRRQFLKIFSAGSLFCLGCGGLGATLLTGQKKDKSAKHKFDEDSRMSFARTYMFAFANMVELLRGLSARMDKGNFIEILKDISSEGAAASMKKEAARLQKNDLAAFTKYMRFPDHFWSHVLTARTIKDTRSEFQIHISECLWAATFKKLKATDLGYACICHPDFAMASAFNPHLTLQRTKTLMQGHDCCNHHWIMTG